MCNSYLQGEYITHQACLLQQIFLPGTKQTVERFFYECLYIIHSL